MEGLVLILAVMAAAFALAIFFRSMRRDLIQIDAEVNEKFGAEPCGSASSSQEAERQRRAA
jgi:hypothetical protein